MRLRAACAAPARRAPVLDGRTHIFSGIIAERCGLRVVLCRCGERREGTQTSPPRLSSSHNGLNGQEIPGRTVIARCLCGRCASLPICQFVKRLTARALSPFVLSHVFPSAPHSRLYPLARRRWPTGPRSWARLTTTTHVNPWRSGRWVMWLLLDGHVSFVTLGFPSASPHFRIHIRIHLGRPCGLGGTGMGGRTKLAWASAALQPCNWHPQSKVNQVAKWWCLVYV